MFQPYFGLGGLPQRKSRAHRGQKSLNYLGFFIARRLVGSGAVLSEWPHLIPRKTRLRHFEFLSNSPPFESMSFRQSLSRGAGSPNVSRVPEVPECIRAGSGLDLSRRLSRYTARRQPPNYSYPTQEYVFPPSSINWFRLTSLPGFSMSAIFIRLLRFYRTLLLDVEHILRLKRTSALWLPPGMIWFHPGLSFASALPNIRAKGALEPTVGNLPRRKRSSVASFDLPDPERVVDKNSGRVEYFA
ncbi:hypothetical protein B0H16DRAFT_1464157 [Mycena metata]|uniref:Uncharacterized protein n=1 Tax=Mycena metata TaxID=1033252 RepID=A0AAD7IHF0_9AGAR|nr:hypothetical protein B0H16DRAFT_1464157 [Mycena metata]